MTARELCSALARIDGWTFAVLIRMNSLDEEHWYEARLSRQKDDVQTILIGKPMPTVEESCRDLLKHCASVQLLESHSIEELIFKVEVLSP